MGNINLNRRLLLKSIGALGTSSALMACGGGNSDSPAAASIQYFTEPFMLIGSTEITGVRGVNNSSDVFLTGINMDTTTTPTTNYGLLYRGPLLISSVSDWKKIGPVKTIIKSVGFEQSSGLNFYGPNNGSTAGSIVVVGNYNLSSSTNAYGLLYRGDISGNGIYTKVSPDSLVVGDTVQSTIMHSNMNGYAVGNFNSSLIPTSRAFIMKIGSTPDDPSTYIYTEIPASLANGGISITAYGIWYNSSLDNYTIAGGYDKIALGEGLSTGYIVDWHPINGFSNFTSLYYNNDSSTSKVSHVEGITSDNAGGYYLSVDWAELVAGAPDGAALVQIKRTSSGGFDTPIWTNFAFPGAQITSANTVFERNILGVYEGPSPTTPYLAVFP